MISGDRSILRGKKGAFWYTLEAFHGYWDRIDVICPHVKAVSGELRAVRKISAHSSQLTAFLNVYFHPNPRGLLWQECWIRKKGMELIREHKHNVMTVHDYPPFFNGAGAMYLSKKTGIPYTLEVHHIVGYPKAASFAEWAGKTFSRFYFPMAAKKAHALRTVSGGVGAELMRWGIPEAKIHMVPSAYLNHALLKPDPSIPKTYDVSCGGRLVVNKGIAEVIRAVAMLPDVTLVVFGEGSLRPKFEALAKSLGIADRVHFAGWAVEGVDVYRTLQSAKIFAMNSRSEGGPRIALEAMALGIPVVSTKVGVMPDVIVDGRNGLFTNGDPRDLSQKLRSLLADAALRDRMGREARDILTKFERKTLIKRYAEFLQSLAQ